MRIHIENGKFVIPANEDIEISKATLRLEDLLPTYKELLGEYADKYDLPEEEDHPWWDDTDEPIYILEDMLNLIDQMTPDTHIFGSHEGDGSLIGFWTYKEEEI